MPRPPLAAALLAVLVALLSAALHGRLSVTSSPVSPPAAVQRRPAVIGRGCDPVRARFAEKHWAPRLGVDMDSATSDEELFKKLAARRFDLFFMVGLRPAAETLLTGALAPATRR